MVRPDRHLGCKGQHTRGDWCGDRDIVDPPTTCRVVYWDLDPEVGWWSKDSGTRLYVEVPLVHSLRER